jgi:hypothetical protein
MWVDLDEIKTTDDKEKQARIRLKSSAGDSLNSVLRWMVARSRSEGEWRSIANWLKRAPVEFDRNIIEVLDAKPTEDELIIMERVIKMLISHLKVNDEAPDLSRLQAQFQDYRRHYANKEETRS